MNTSNIKTISVLFLKNNDWWTSSFWVASSSQSYLFPFFFQQGSLRSALSTVLYWKDVRSCKLYFRGVISACLRAAPSRLFFFSDCSTADNESLTILTLTKYISVQTIKQNQPGLFPVSSQSSFPLDLAPQKPCRYSQCELFWQVKQKKQEIAACDLLSYLTCFSWGYNGNTKTKTKTIDSKTFGGIDVINETKGN